MSRLVKTTRHVIAIVVDIHGGDDTRARGSNVLDGGADVIISVNKDKLSGISTAKIEELKDGEAGLSWRFRLVQIKLDGPKHFECFGAVTETISNPRRIDRTETAAKQKLNGSQRRFMDILAEAILSVGEMVPGSTIVPFNIKAITRERLKKFLIAGGFLDPQKPDAARSTFSRAINDLSGKHIIGSTAEHVWLPK